MAIREIRKEKDEILYKRCKEIDIIDDKIKDIIQDMIDTMYKYDGIGIAASQIGVLKRILVYDVDYQEEGHEKSPTILINPVITKYSRRKVTTEEGCLSFPDLFGYVDRSEDIEVEGLDLEGKKIKVKAKDLNAVVIQHEYDHLDGKVFIDVAYDLYKGDRNKKK